MSQCTGTVKRTGKRCQRQAIKGGTVCGGRGSHGGNAPQVKAAAARRVAEAKASQALSREGIKPVDNPIEALQQLAGEVVRLKDYLGDRVERLEELRYRGVGGEQVRGELQAYGSALDRSIRVLESMAKLNIESRLVRITEEQAALVVEALKAIFARLIGDTDGDIRAMLFPLVAFELRQHGPSPVTDLAPEVVERAAEFSRRWRDAERIGDIERRAVAAAERMEREVQARVEAEVARRMQALNRPAIEPRRPLALEAGS